MKLDIERLIGAPSKVAVIRVLCRSEGPLKASEIAGRSGVSPPQVGRVLAELRGLGAVQETATTKSPAYRLADEFRAAVEALFRLEDESIDAVVAQVTAAMADLGAPLSRPKTTVQAMPPERALPLAVRFARHDATLLSTLPVVMKRLADERTEKGFWDSIHREARKEGVERHLGMLLELCGGLLESRRLLDEAARYRPKAGCRVYLRPFRGYFRNTWERTLAVEKTPAAARRWGFLMNMDENDFRHHLGGAR